jgi:hypothetical protein
MDAYNKQMVNDLLGSTLVIHWWNHGTKTAYFNGTAKEYFKKEKITYKITPVENGMFESLKIRVKFNHGSLNNIQFTTNNMEDAIRMVVNIQLSYLCDKAQFSFNHRTRTINF